MNSIGWKFYLVLICPSFFYIIWLYFNLPETKGRTLEEIGGIFGDKNIANRWYGLNEQEKAAVFEKAVMEDKKEEANVESAQNIEDIRAA